MASIWKSLLAAVFLVGLAAGGIYVTAAFLQRSPADDPVFMDGGSNQYAKAQAQVVLVVTPDGQGSGVVVKRRSLDTDKIQVFVWTAAHVVAGHSEVTVKRILRHDGSPAGEMVFRAYVLYDEMGIDAAVLWVDAPPSVFAAAEFDGDDYPFVGEDIFHVGNFYGELFDGSVSVGIVSQIGVSPEWEGWPWALTDQVTATIVPGSSGGPVFRAANGKVLGLIVGGPTRGMDGIAVYVPARVIYTQAEISGMTWAVSGGFCPSADVIQKSIEVRKKLLEVTPLPVEWLKPVIFDIPVSSENL